MTELLIINDPRVTEGTEHCKWCDEDSNTEVWDGQWGKVDLVDVTDGFCPHYD